MPEYCPDKSHNVQEKADTNVKLLALCKRIDGLFRIAVKDHRLGFGLLDKMFVMAKRLMYVKKEHTEADLMDIEWINETTAYLEELFAIRQGLRTKYFSEDLEGDYSMPLDAYNIIARSRFIIGLLVEESDVPNIRSQVAILKSDFDKLLNAPDLTSEDGNDDKEVGYELFDHHKACVEAMIEWGLRLQQASFGRLKQEGIKSFIGKAKDLLAIITANPDMDVRQNVYMLRAHRDALKKFLSDKVEFSQSYSDFVFRYLVREIVNSPGTPRVVAEDWTSTIFNIEASRWEGKKGCRISLKKPTLDEYDGNDERNYEVR